VYFIRLFLRVKKIRAVQIDTMNSEVDDMPLTNVSVNKDNEEKILSHLPGRPPVDVEFLDLSYAVPQGRKGK